jgi:predicted ABC-type ATPase
MSARPQLWLLAGGNGAGKSTFYRRFLAPLGVSFVNADLIARELDRRHPELVGYQASRLAERLRLDLLQAGRSFCFETVFSHPSKIDFVAQAKALDYQVVLVFIHLQGDELNQARVAQRVSEGGHGVPTEKIVTRIPRTLQHIRTALPLADKARLYDNSSAASPFQTVAQIAAGRLVWAADPLPGWAGVVLHPLLDVADDRG